MSLPIKINVKTEWFSILILLVSVLFGFYFYAHFPDRVVSHWDFAGHATGYLSKFWGAFIFPMILCIIYLLFLAIPFLDPKKDDYHKFEHPYNIFRVAILLALFLVSLTAGFYNLGRAVDVAHSITLIIGSLFLVMGYYLRQVKLNWFIGIRTPWTLSSESVWDQIHRLGGKFMMCLGIILIVAPWLPKVFGIQLFLAGLLAFVLWAFIYSYVLYRRERR